MEKAFPWIPLPTKFGINYLSTCSIKIQTRNRQWIERSLKIDSGADATMFELSDLYSLGYSKKDCIKERYNNVNLTNSLGYGRLFKLMMGDYVIPEVPIIFSATPIAIPLLGRAKIIELLDIIFDSRVNVQYFAPSHDPIVNRLFKCP